jgi:hypothetical protein
MGAFADELTHLLHGRLKAGPHALHHEAVRAVRARDDLARALVRHRERLLDHQVFSRFEGLQREPVVLRIGRREVHHVDALVREELGVAAVGACSLDAVALAERTSPLERP